MRTHLLLLTVSVAGSLQGQVAWQQETSCPGDGRSQAFAVAVGDQAYAGTGQIGETTGFLDDFWTYDPATDVWTALADFPGGNRAGVTAWSAAGRLFAGFGWNGTAAANDLYEYLPTSNTWETRFGLSGAGLAYAPGFVLGNRLYIGPQSGTNHVHVYDITTGLWSTVADFPGTWRNRHAAFAVDGKGYLGGGRDADDNVLTDWWVYDPATDSWSSIANLEPATDESSACVVNGSGYVLNAGSGEGDLFRYKADTDEWVLEGTLPIYRLSRGSMFSIGTTGYHAFGLKRVLANLVPSNELWSFTPTVGISEMGAVQAISVRYEADGSVWLTSDRLVPSGAVLQVQDAAGRILEQRNLGAGVPLQVRITPDGRAPGLRFVSIRSAEGPVVCRVFL
jgi:hypothetical protein